MLSEDRENLIMALRPTAGHSPRLCVFRSKAAALASILTVTALILSLGPRPALAASAAPPAPHTTAFLTKGSTAFATFQSFDPTGCVVTNVFVLGSRLFEFFVPGGRQEIPTVDVDVVRFNVCTSTSLLAASGTTSTFDLHMARDLSRATLVAPQIHTIDFSTATVFDVDVNVSWDGTANLIRQANTTFIKNPREIIVAAQVGWTRAAQATGTVSHGGTNYIQSPSTNAEVQFLLSGEIDITRTG